MFVKTPLTLKIKDGLWVKLSVRAKEMSLEPVCDLCGDPKPVVAYAAKHTGGKCWRWCFCATCDDAVERKDWQTILARLRERTRQMLLSEGRQTTERMLSGMANRALNDFLRNAAQEHRPVARMIRVDDPSSNRPIEACWKHMQGRGGRWAAFQNQDMGHHDLGRLAFLQYGPGCSYPHPPQRYPDTPAIGLGWRYLHVGFVNLETGEIEHQEQPNAEPADGAVSQMGAKAESDHGRN